MLREHLVSSITYICYVKQWAKLLQKCKDEISIAGFVHKVIIICQFILSKRTELKQLKQHVKAYFIPCDANVVHYNGRFKGHWYNPNYARKSEIGHPGSYLNEHFTTTFKVDTNSVTHFIV